MVFTQEQIEAFSGQGFEITADGVFAKYSGQEAHVEIPAGVTEIGQQAFHGCSIISVVIPDSVTLIKKYAFSSCFFLQSVVLPKGVTEIDYCTFVSCYRLNLVVIPEGVRKIGQYAFADCNSLISVVIPKGVTKIDRSAFYGCSSIVSMVLPDSVTEIGLEAFAGCSSLKEVFCSEKVKKKLRRSGVDTDAVVHAMLPEAWRPSSLFVYTSPRGVMQRCYDPRSFAWGSVMRETIISQNRAQNRGYFKEFMMTVLLVYLRLDNNNGLVSPPLPMVVIRKLLEYAIYKSSGTDDAGRYLPLERGVKAYWEMVAVPEGRRKKAAAPEPEGVSIGTVEVDDPEQARGPGGEPGLCHIS